MASTNIKQLIVPRRHRDKVKVVTFWASLVLIFILAAFSLASAAKLIPSSFAESISGAKTALELLTFLSALLYIITLTEEVNETNVLLKDKVESTLTLIESRSSPHVKKMFQEACSQWINSIGKVEKIDICAFTSISYRQVLIQALPKQIEQVRLLLFIHEGTKSVDGKHINIEEEVNDWKNLTDDPYRARRVDVKRIKTNAQFFFSIADERNCLFGLLTPRQSIRNLHTTNTYIITDDSLEAKSAITDLSSWFSNYWDLAEAVVSYEWNKP